MEAAFGGVGQRPAKVHRRDGGVRHDKAQRGRHIRVDHAGALGHAGNPDRVTAQRQLRESHLGDAVRGHDGAGSFRKTRLVQLGNQLRQRLDDALGIQLDSNHARRGRQNLMNWNAESLGGGTARGLRRLHPRARRAVGVSGIGQDGTGFATGGAQVLAAQLHRRRLNAICSEHRRRGSRHVGDNQREVVLLLFSDARVC